MLVNQAWEVRSSFLMTNTYMYRIYAGSQVLFAFSKSLSRPAGRNGAEPLSGDFNGQSSLLYWFANQQQFVYFT